MMLPLLFTVFIDSLGFGLVFPIFSPMIVGNEAGMFSPESSLALRGLIFGLLVSAYCIGQFFGGPILGGLSDRMGRKKILVGSMWLAFMGYLAGGFGIIIQSLWILFASRILVGLAAGSFAVAQSVVADISTKEDKTKKFGLVGMACWTGFVIGPFVGGKLAVYGFTVPFAFSAAVCLLTAILLLFRFKESRFNAPGGKIEWLKGITQIRTAFTIPDLRGIFFVMFIFCLGWGFFTEFSPIFLTEHLNYNVSEIANFFAWVGLWIALCQGIFIRPLLKKISPQRLFAFGLLGLGLVLPVLLLTRQTLGLYLILPFVAFFESLIFPTSATLVSDRASKEAQGEILGIHNAVQWAAIAIPPLFSGSLVALFPHLPVSVGSISMLFGFGVFLFVFRKKREKVEAKVEVDSDGED